VALPGSPDDALDRIARVTAEQVGLDAQRLAEQLFGDHMPANMVLIGAAYQAGVLPVRAEALEQAIRLNGAAVDNTLAAFRWGRAAVQDPAAVWAAIEPPARETVAVDAVARSRAAEIGLGDVLATRIADLTGYQNAAYADRYAEDVRRVRDLATTAAGPEIGDRIGVAYARGLHKLMAYKDEYEVARLHLDPVEIARREEEYGVGAKVSVLLHPPLLRAMGMKRKLRLRATATPAFRALRAARKLRGTPLDIFGYAKLRRLERELIGQYQKLVRDALDRLDAATADLVEELAGLPDLVRGYEEVKLANVDRFRARAAEILAKLG
jgi:indolepyruvate ferredoxin oxidoreductase